MASIFQSAGQPINPKPAVGIQHHLDDGGIFEKGCDCRPKRRAQHTRAAGNCVRRQNLERHIFPVLPNCTDHPGQGNISSDVKFANATGYWSSECYSAERQADGDLHRQLMSEPPTNIS
jgi:hypothetical protein